MWIAINQNFLLWGQYLRKWYIRKVKFGNAKNSSVFNVKILPISQLLGSMGFKVIRLTCVRLTLALMLRNLRLVLYKAKFCDFVKCSSNVVSFFKNMM